MSDVQITIGNQDDAQVISASLQETQIVSAVPGVQGPAGEGVPGGGTTNQVLFKQSDTSYDTAWSNVTSAMIGDLEIVNADVASGAAIAGTKISPNFGSQNVLTTGTSTAASFIPSSSSVPANGLYLPSANNVAISTNGTGRLFVDASGVITTDTAITSSRFNIVNPNSVSTYDRLLAIRNGSLTTAFLGVGVNSFYIASAPATSTVFCTNSDGGVTGTSVPTNERMRITSDGKVGLGTSSPSVNLDISPASGAAEVRIAGAEGQEASIRLFADQGDDAADIKRLLTDTSGNFKIQHYSGSNFVDSLVINSSGNVGVGTASPQRDLQLGDNTTAFRVISLQTTTAGTSSIYFGDNTATSAEYAGMLRYSHSDDAMQFWTSSSERARIDSSGRLLVGTSTARSNFYTGGNNYAQILNEGTNYQTSTIATISNSNAFGSYLVLGRSRGTAVGSNTIVQQNDALGIIDFLGSDGSRFLQAARINAESDGTPGANDMPGRLVFSTTADGASSPTERMRIDSSGRVGIGTTSPSFDFQVDKDVNSVATSYTRSYNAGSSAGGRVTAASNVGSLNMSAYSSTHSTWANTCTISSESTFTGGLVVNAGGSNPLRFWTNSTEQARIDSSGRLGLGTSDPTSGTSSYYDDFVIKNGTSGSGAGITIQSNSTNGFSGLNLRKADGTDLGKLVASAADSKIYIESSGSAAITIDSSQRVGVGTTSPQRLLHVHESAAGVNGYIQLTNAATGSASTNGLQLLVASPGKEALIIQRENASLDFWTNNTERARIDSSGRFLVGTSTSVLNGSTIAGKLQVADTVSTAIISAATWINNANGSLLVLGKSRSTTPGSYTIVNNNDLIGALRFAADDGTDLNTRAAEIKAEVDGTPGADDMPGRLVFSTTADGASSPTERMRIDSSGRVGVGTTNPGARLEVNGGEIYNVNGAITQYMSSGGGTAVIGTLSNTDWSLRTNNNERCRIDTSGRLLVGTSSAETASLGARFQIQGTGSAASALIKRNDNGSLASYLYFGKSRGTTVGSTTIVQSGDNLGEIRFTGADGSTEIGSIAASIAAAVDGTPGANDMPGRLVFSTTADAASSPTERMRISANGQIKATCDGGLFAYRPTADTASVLIGGYSDVTGTEAAQFIVRTNGNVESRTNSYGAISDAKIKENVLDASSQWEDIKNVRVRKYNLIGDNASTQIGVIAQELEKTSPGLISESVDYDEDGVDLGMVTKSVKYSVLYMKAVKALQEAMERIETLEAKVAALETP